MNFSHLMATPQVICYANDNTGSIDEQWVMATLMFLKSNMVASGLVKRDFESVIQDHGDIINVRRPNEFGMIRTQDGSNLETQDATGTKIQVPLDQWATVSFLINDGERSKSFANLVTEYLEPAAIALAKSVDRIVLGQVARLLTYTAGELGAMDSTNAQEFLVDVDKVLNDNECPPDNRNLILSTNAKAQLLKSSIVVEADKRGDEGSALRNASVGRIYNMATWMDQNVNSVSPNDVDKTAYVVGSSAYAAGYAGVIDTVDTPSTTQVVGEFVVIAGEGHPHVLSALTGTTDDITLVEPLKKAVAAAADVDIYNAADVNLVAGYAVDWDGVIQIDGLDTSKPLQVGQLLAHGTGASRETYSIIKVAVTSTTENGVTLDRPLDTAMANNDVVFPGPAGDMNVCLHPDALALVVRPLAEAPSGQGADSFTRSFEGLSIRMTASYDGLAQATRVTLDFLCGVQVLNTKLACVLLS